MDFADEIVSKIDSLDGVVPPFDIDIHLPSLLLCLVFSHPQALIRACKEADAVVGALTDKEIVRLPCLHTPTPCVRVIQAYVL